MNLLKTILLSPVKYVMGLIILGLLLSPFIIGAYFISYLEANHETIYRCLCLGLLSLIAFILSVVAYGLGHEALKVLLDKDD